jgi:hypothetical protein
MAYAGTNQCSVRSYYRKKMKKYLSVAKQSATIATKVVWSKFKSNQICFPSRLDGARWSIAWEHAILPSFLNVRRFSSSEFFIYTLLKSSLCVEAFVTQFIKADFLLLCQLIYRFLEFGVASFPVASSLYCWSASSVFRCFVLPAFSRLREHIRCN